MFTVEGRQVDWKKPTHSELVRAMSVYLEAAYANATVPRSVAAKVDGLAAVSDETVYSQPAIEKDAAQPGTRFSIRLGNRAYPHMKMVVERSPDGHGHLFRADTHDRHIRPQPGTRDAEAFAQLMVENGRIAEAIEEAWDAGGMPTFKAFLREDLRRRKMTAGSPSRSSQS